MSNKKQDEKKLQKVVDDLEQKNSLILKGKVFRKAVPAVDDLLNVLPVPKKMPPLLHDVTKSIVAGIMSNMLDTVLKKHSLRKNKKV
jgi:hypothetical protein